MSAGIDSDFVDWLSEDKLSNGLPRSSLRKSSSSSSAFASTTKLTAADFAKSKLDSLLHCIESIDVHLETEDVDEEEIDDLLEFDEVLKRKNLVESPLESEGEVDKEFEERNQNQNRSEEKLPSDEIYDERILPPLKSEHEMSEIMEIMEQVSFRERELSERS